MFSIEFDVIIGRPSSAGVSLARSTADLIFIPSVPSRLLFSTHPKTARFAPLSSPPDRPGVETAPDQAPRSAAHPGIVQPPNREWKRPSQHQGLGAVLRVRGRSARSPHAHKDLRRSGSG